MDVKIARIKRGLTQKQLSEKAHISPNKLVQIEKGNYCNVTYEQMTRISKVLDTSVVELFFKN
ncbi:helix-turn-helix transcriptional regulator [Clostridium felsineum]|uniref:helix-turn-helix transcriptional regulator n=1 Tax=Clostridium felsineum TaxID=36839 RepID=UPI00098CE789|nr:helix-turn-helix transcriptional regulator [Clostridium felsineum]URZ02737.1 hypothetical protein CLAUR_027610 [Clostridium felsineum]